MSEVLTKELVNLVRSLITAQLNLTHYQCEVAGMNAANLEADITDMKVPYTEEDFKKISHVYHTRIQKTLTRLNYVQERRNQQPVYVGNADIRDSIVHKPDP